MSKTDLPFRFCKIVLRNTLFILGTEMVVCLYVLFVLQMLAFKKMLAIKKIVALCKLRKMQSRT